ncbi:uncharacterized protein [Clytia hemisphaerica]|uniref:Uncharacterized protein n=1 Tax=Clytia hemisphaerica TaxID=252671 RepID=A0A7M6DQD7_9CNID
MGKSKKNTESKESDEEIDFTKPLPKDFMPEDINQPLTQEDETTQESGNEESESESGGVSQEEYPEEDTCCEPPKPNGDNQFKKKAVAVMMIFPMIVTAFITIGDTLDKFKLDKTAMQVTATIGGAGIALYAISRIPQLKEAVKFVICFSWLVFLYPTYQVYTCSPIEMKNSMIGTWFKLATTPNDFLEKSYVASECFNKQKLQSPYMMSALAAKVSLVIQINDLINLKGQQKEGDEDPGDVGYFLAVSKRSVKKKFHKLYLIIEADDKLAQMLSRALTLDSKEKNKNLLVMTGSVMTLEDELLPMKKELEKMQYLVRPVKFKATKVVYRDKYAKLKHVDESLY